MTLTKLQFRITLLDDGVRFSKGGKSTNVVDDLADNPRNRGSLADDFARGCTSSLSPLGQLALELKTKQQARLVASSELNAGMFDDGSFEIAKKLCANWQDKFRNNIKNPYLEALPLEGEGAGIRFKPQAQNGGKPLVEKYKNPRTNATGVLDESGSLWSWDNQHLDHFDVTLKDGRHFGVYPDGRFRASSGISSIDELPNVYYKMIAE